MMGHLPSLLDGRTPTVGNLGPVGVRGSTSRGLNGAQGGQSSGDGTSDGQSGT